jgi:excinuclease ABC subunit A
VGLGYLRLGQSATTLSGGEAQRIKLASHLGQASCEKTLFIFDEPTTGLHFDDIAKLLRAFERLLENGGSILIIEHNLDVIQSADWVIDLGPEGGSGGGEIVAEGPPEVIANTPESYTGRFLKPLLEPASSR